VLNKPQGIIMMVQNSFKVIIVMACFVKNGNCKKQERIESLRANDGSRKGIDSNSRQAWASWGGVKG